MVFGSEPEYQGFFLGCFYKVFSFFLEFLANVQFKFDIIGIDFLILSAWV